MARTMAFDVYGTLIDPLGIAGTLAEMIGSRSTAFAAAWRDKQLEYLFRRGLGGDYAPFSVCTRQALEFTCAARGTDLAAADRDRLLERYLRLPPYPGVRAALERLAGSGDRLFAFSNGEPDDLGVLLERAGLRDSLDGIVSTHEVRSFKPDPAVYAHFLEQTGADAGDAWLVSGNAFDIIGAHRQGWRTAWLRRAGSPPFDPWGVEPTVTIAAIDSLVMPGA